MKNCVTRLALVLPMVFVIGVPMHAANIAPRTACCAMPEGSPSPSDAESIPVPEPATLLLLGTGLSIVALRLRSLRRK
jgi:hypothetical protein